MAMYTVRTFQVHHTRVILIFSFYLYIYKHIRTLNIFSDKLNFLG